MHFLFLLFKHSNWKSEGKSKQLWNKKIFKNRVEYEYMKYLNETAQIRMLIIYSQSFNTTEKWQNTCRLKQTNAESFMHLQHTLLGGKKSGTEKYVHKDKL